MDFPHKGIVVRSCKTNKFVLGAGLVTTKHDLVVYRIYFMPNDIVYGETIKISELLFQFFSNQFQF